MKSNLHSLVAIKAESDPAILIGDNLLIDLLTRRLSKAISKHIGQYQRYPSETGKVQIGITECTYHHANAGWMITLPTKGIKAGLFLFESKNSFQVTFSVTANADATLGLFKVVLSISKVSAVVLAGYNTLSIGNVNIDLASSIVLDKNASKNAQDIGLSDIEINRLQGLIEGSVAVTVLNNIFSGSPSVDLSSLFPTVVFQGQTELAVIKGGLLIIARNGWRIDETQRCPCAGDLPEIHIHPLPAKQDNDTGGTVDFDVEISKPRNWLVETQVEADVALYLPQPTVVSLTSGPYPAITDYASDNGFIGWALEYTIGFADALVSLTDPRATIVLKLGFFIDGHGNVSVDVPCAGRQTVGLMSATNRDNGLSIVEIGITPQL